MIKYSLKYNYRLSGTIHLQNFLGEHVPDPPEGPKNFPRCGMGHKDLPVFIAAGLTAL